jgi:HEXXH motif-containing protein
MQASIIEPWLLNIDGRSIRLPDIRRETLSARLSVLDATTAAELRRYDLHAIPPYADAAKLLDLSEDLIRVVPELLSVIYRCAYEIILLRTFDDAYDVSHSDPRWATRIFVSVPKLSATAHLRVAEAVVHEAMHLNLTFLERYAPLTQTSRTLYSPWKAEPRPASGVLHGIYVFGCIHSFFERLRRQHALDHRARSHIVKRLADIRAEIALIDRSQLLSCLSPTGASVGHAAFAALGN